MLAYRKIASASSGNVKRAVELCHREISKDWFCSATLQDGQQHPLTHVLHLNTDTNIHKSWNQDIFVIWLNVYLGHQNWYPKMDYNNWIPLREAPSERFLNAPAMWRQLQRMQLTVSVSRVCNPQPLNPSITNSTSVHLNSPALHAFNQHSSARRDMTSHYTFILL
jgi:hypothetical protein